MNKTSMNYRVILVVSLTALSLSGGVLAQENKPSESKTKKETAATAAGSLDDYVGRYGKKEIFIRDGGLYYQRIGGRGGALRPIGKDKFALAEDAQLTFKRDAKGVVVEVAIDWVAFPDELLQREPLTGGPSTGSDPALRVPVRKEPPNQSSNGSALDAATLAQLKTIMTHLLETIYVSPEIGTRLARQLKEKFEAGAYASAANQAELAEMLTRDLRGWSNDRHLNVRYNPEASGDAILDPESWEKQRPSMFPRVSDSGSRPRGPAPDQRMIARLEQDNYHFRQTKILSGNVGFLEVGGFAPASTSAEEKAAQAMRALANSDAVIIDLRDCPGGSADMVDFLASYFFDAEPRVLMNRYIRPTNEHIQNKTLADIPGKRMPDTDLYILVSAHTASAGESFSYTLQQYGRAVIVGEKTAGAGYNNIILPLGKNLAFSVSYGRPEHPRSGKGWEAVGVQPDIAVPAADALVAAHKAALQKMITKTADERRKKELMAALEELERTPASTAGA
ncbi:MAG TPA: S41 family peptidase [Chthoniobacterales bacterium]|nr:S41 family peptidase [Chthoniobacterales bacterium]